MAFAVASQLDPARLADAELASSSAAAQYIADTCLSDGPVGRVGLEIEAHCYDPAEPHRRPAWDEISDVLESLPIMPGGSLLTLTYLGGETVIPGYNVMGICKAALESSTRYLASELGGNNIRVNALSAGPLKTLSSSAVGEFDQMLKLYTSFSPLRRNISPEEVANAGMYLLSHLAGGITGETLHVDAGYHIMGAPPADMHAKL